MAMALTGTLDAFGLAEVLQLLAATAKTGRLEVDGDGGRGRLWLRDGALAEVTTDRVADAPIDEALCDLLRFRDGGFTFEVDDRSPEVASPQSLDLLLDRAYALLAEWQELEAAVPSLAHQVALAPIGENDQVTVTAQQWPALVAVGGGCTVAELSTRLELSELNTLRTVNDLLSSGLVALASTRRAGRSGRAGRSAGPASRNDRYGGRAPSTRS
jgi:hypothetical protein